MTVFSVFEQPDLPQKGATTVPDGFSVFAALLPPVHALIHGLWLGFAGIVAVLVLLVPMGQVLGAAAATWLYLLGAVFYGLEAGALRRWTLLRRGWRHRAEIVASDRALAELEWLRRREATS